MSSELTRSESSLPSVPTQQINVEASGNGLAIGNNYGNMIINLPPEAIALLPNLLGNLQPQVSHIAEWTQLSRSIFNVFVLRNEKYDRGSFSISKRVALTQLTPEYYQEYFRPLTSALIGELLNMPCIFAIKNDDYMTAYEGCPAFLGKLKEIRCQEETIRFEFEAFCAFKSKFINEHIRDFNLVVTTVRNQLDVEHWSIREGNLIQIAERLGLEIK